MTEQHRWDQDGVQYVMLQGDEPMRCGGQIFFPGLRYSATNVVVAANRRLFAPVAPEVQPDTEDAEEAPRSAERLGDPEE